jgi:hypothetical protein
VGFSDGIWWFSEAVWWFSVESFRLFENVFGHGVELSERTLSAEIGTACVGRAGMQNSTAGKRPGTISLFFDPGR